MTSTPIRRGERRSTERKSWRGLKMWISLSWLWSLTRRLCPEWSRIDASRRFMRDETLTYWRLTWSWCLKMTERRREEFFRETGTLLEMSDPQRKRRTRTPKSFRRRRSQMISRWDTFTSLTNECTARTADRQGIMRWVALRKQRWKDVDSVRLSTDWNLSARIFSVLSAENWDMKGMHVRTKMLRLVNSVIFQVIGLKTAWISSYLTPSSSRALHLIKSSVSHVTKTADKLTAKW